MSKKIINSPLRYASGPWGSTFVVVGSVFVGIVLSAFLTEIQTSPPFSWIKSWSLESSFMTIPAIAFWVLFSLVALVAVMREIHRYHQARHDRDELQRNIEDVKEVASTMPPKDYLRRFADDFSRVNFESDLIFYTVFYEITSHQGDDGENSLPAAELSQLRTKINKTIRIVLDSMINLALHFDQSHKVSGITYSADIMWLQSPQDFKDRHVRETLWSAAEPLSDCENAEMFFSAVDRLLILDVNLTTNSTNAGVPDTDELHHLCLGYKHEDRGIGYNLPGAPQTLATGEYSHVPDSRAIAETLTEYGQQAQKRVASYYEKDTRGRSILSMPLAGYDPSSGEEVGAIIAVVSVYRNSPGIMEGDHRALMFNHQMAPFVGLLYRLCWIRQVIDVLEGSSLSVYTHISDVDSDTL